MTTWLGPPKEVEDRFDPDWIAKHQFKLLASALGWDKTEAEFDEQLKEMAVRHGIPLPDEWKSG